MKIPPLFVDGKPLPTGKRIGGGGEGEIYAVDNGSGLAVKIYKHPDGDRERKVAAMIAAGLAARSPLIAFPMALVRDRSGKFLGFTMRHVKGHEPLFELYAPGSRKMTFPKANYRFMVRAAANIARAVGHVHFESVVIGDINHSGILVSEKAVASLIDADSFQFAGHVCRVGAPEYTPPELQGKKLAGVTRTAAHDAFGLAIVTFQLLFMGRHPFVGRFSGQGDMPLEKAISEYRFAYSSRKEVGMTPPPGACRLTDFPSEIGLAFEAAFGRDPQARPTPVQWVSILQALEQGLRKCSANELHYFPAAAEKCVWCRMEQTVGMILFMPPLIVTGGATVIDPGAAGFDLGNVWAAIARVQVPDPSNLMPPLPTTAADPSDAAKAHKREQFWKRGVGVAAIIVAVALLFGEPTLWLIYVPLAWFGVVWTFGTAAEGASFGGRYIKAEQDFQAALEEWRKRTGAVEMHDRRNALHEAMVKLRDLPEKQKRILAEYESKRRALQLQRFLDSYPIHRARIRGIGPSREAALASYGIDTAADVTRRAVLAVPGFGEATAKPLFEWRARLESRFVFSQQPTTADLQGIEQIRRNFATEAAQLRQTLLRGANELMVGVTTVQTRLRAPDPVVGRAFAEREQAKADLQFLGYAIPRVPVISPAPAPAPAPRHTTAPTTRHSPSAAIVTCPSCGGAMVRRTAKRGLNRGGSFWGCAKYPRCHGTRRI